MIYYSSERQRWEDTTNPWWFVEIKEQRSPFDSKDDFYRWLLNETDYLDGEK